MAANVQLTIEERLVYLLQHLGLERAHFAARLPTDWSGLASARPEMISSLTLACPSGIDSSGVQTLASRLLVLTGDQGPLAERAARVAASLPSASLITLRDYFSPPWADIMADRTDEISRAMTDFLQEMDQKEEMSPVQLPQGEGEVAGISYRIVGSGPPLVLLPLALAPSEWEPLIPVLSERYCTISLGGAELGMVTLLEARGHSAPYLRVVRNLLDEVHLQPGEVVLDVGCGSGVLDRWLVNRTGGENQVVGVDINPYLIREATALAKKEGLEGFIEFHEGNAEALPFPDSRFNVVMSSTVMEEVDAERMLSEMIRVATSGGRVAVIVRAADMQSWVNLPLGAGLKTKVDATLASFVGDRGCADASLYQRFREAGLGHVRMFPQLAAFDDKSHLQYFQDRVLPTLNPEEADEWRAALSQAEAEGTFFIARPQHCAVGTKP